jgi:TetR/AcrR family transcriptional regulator, regulator of autoinduction and epiphytic fitness
MTSVADFTPGTDGRWMRSARTRVAIIDAWIELIQAGDLAPTAKSVADRARIGLRTIFQHFTDMNSLHGAAGEEFIMRLAPCATHIRGDLALAERVDLIIADRSRLFEAVTMVRRSCERQEWMSADVHGVIQRWERAGAQDTARVFATELDRLPAEHQMIQTLAINTVLSWSTWNHLRSRCVLSTEDARAVMMRSLTSLLPPVRHSAIAT